MQRFHSIYLFQMNEFYVNDVYRSMEIEICCERIWRFQLHRRQILFSLETSTKMIHSVVNWKDVLHSEFKHTTNEFNASSWKENISHGFYASCFLWLTLFLPSFLLLLLLLLKWVFFFGGGKCVFFLLSHANTLRLLSASERVCLAYAKADNNW